MTPDRVWGRLWAQRLRRVFNIDIEKFLKEQHGADGRAWLYRLFPYGYMQQTCKIAGMRRPRAWSTG